MSCSSLAARRASWHTSCHSSQSSPTCCQVLLQARHAQGNTVHYSCHNRLRKELREFLFVKHTVQTEWPVAMVAMLFLRSCCPTVRASKETPLGLQPDASLQGCCIRSLDILIFASALLLWPADASCTVPVLARDVGPRSFLGCSRSEIQQLQQQWHSRCSTQPSSL